MAHKVHIFCTVLLQPLSSLDFLPLVNALRSAHESRPSVQSHLSRHFFSSPFGCFCGNNEAWGTCFLQVPNNGRSYHSPADSSTRVCVCNVNRVRGGAASRWTLPPSAVPASCPPDELWLAGAYCPRSADKRWKSDGTFQPFCPPPPHLWPIASCQGGESSLKSQSLSEGGKPLQCIL